MNLSGEAVAALCSRHRARPADILVVHDDMDLPLGRMRLRAGGSSGGHKGIQSIIESLGTRDFARLKLGIGRPDRVVGEGAIVDYVLGDFTLAERGLVEPVLARAAEANDIDTGNHIMRVGEYAGLMARELNQSEKFTELIRSQATLHDVGKVHIPSHILKKAGRLTPEEMEEMKKHTTFGAMIIGDHPHLEFGKRIALCHHERWDGTGYPKGLKGTEIPLEARITAICDCYDALRNSRVYKPNYDHDGAVGIITKGDDRMKPEHFDPEVMAAFIKLTPRFDELYQKMRDGEKAGG